MPKRPLLLLSLLALLVSCEDATDNLFPVVAPVQLPAETRVGANTFGCHVNGQAWEASNTRTLEGRVLTPTARYQHGELHLDAFRRLQVEGPITNIALLATHITGPGVYTLAAPQGAQGGSVHLATIGGLVDYATDAQHVGTLTITRLDTTGAHPGVAGRFALRAVARSGTSSPADFPAELTIADGRFDIQLSR